MIDKIPLILLLSAGAILSCVWLITQRKKIDLSWYAAVFIAIIHTVYGVFTVKAFAFLETGFRADSLGNMSLFGGVFFMPVMYWLLAKILHKAKREIFDIFTPCMVMTVMCARFNCILSGCCRGMMIPGTNGIEWPTRELEILFYIVLLVLLIPRIWNNKTNGTAYPIYMASYGIFRFLIEFLRASDSPAFFHRAHLWAAVAVVVGLSIYYENRYYEEKQTRMEDI